MRYLFILFLAAVWAAPCGAQDLLLTITGAAPGKYVLTVNADRTVTVGPFAQTLSLVGPGPAPLPPPPPPPGPGPTERSRAVQLASASVVGDPDRAGTAHGLASLYRQMAAMFRAAPTATQDQLFKSLNLANDTYLSSRSAATAWLPVRQVIGRYWTVLTDPNKSGTPADFALLLEECATGLDASAPAGAEGEAVLDPNIVNTIKLILQLILAILNNLPTPPVP